LTFEDRRKCTFKEYGNKQKKLWKTHLFSLASCQPPRKSRILMSLVPKCQGSATLLSIPYLKGCFLHKPLINGLLLKAMNAPERSQTMEASQRSKRISSKFSSRDPPLPIMPSPRGGGPGGGGNIQVSPRSILAGEIGQELICEYAGNVSNLFSFIPVFLNQIHRMRIRIQAFC
jgi:hypothetical protein